MKFEMFVFRHWTGRSLLYTSQRDEYLLQNDIDIPFVHIIYQIRRQSLPSYLSSHLSCLILLASSPSRYFLYF